jgi:hypothetical protein
MCRRARILYPDGWGSLPDSGPGSREIACRVREPKPRGVTLPHRFRSATGPGKTAPRRRIAKSSRSHPLPATRDGSPPRRPSSTRSQGGQSRPCSWIRVHVDRHAWLSGRVLPTICRPDGGRLTEAGNASSSTPSTRSSSAVRGSPTVQERTPIRSGRWCCAVFRTLAVRGSLRRAGPDGT